MISFCTWIKDRLWQYKQVIEINIERASGYDSEFILLNCGSKDGLVEWLNETGLIDKIKYYYYDTSEIHFSKLKNKSHSYAIGDILVCLDADNIIGEEYCQSLTQSILTTKESIFHGWTGDWSDGTTGRLAYHKDVFYSLGGYDEDLLPCGFQDLDLRDRAKEYGYKINTITNRKISGSSILNSIEEKMKFLGIEKEWTNMNTKNRKVSIKNIQEKRLIANVE